MKRGDLVEENGYYGIVLRVGGGGGLRVFWGTGLESFEWESSAKPVLLPNSKSPATFCEILKETA